jgi:hypothetical protein
MVTPPNYEAIYHELGALMADAPPLDYGVIEGIPQGTVKWLGQVSALINRVGDLQDSVPFDATSELFVRGMGSGNKLLLIMYRVLAKLEARVPAGSKGAFVVAGDEFDGFAALAKLLGSATKDILIVDPYMDESAVLEYSALVAEGVVVCLLASEDSVKPGLEPAARKWIAQYGGARPISVRLAPPKSLHDRLIFVDGVDAFIVTQSLKDFAKRSHASIQRADADTATMKASAYSDLWNSAKVTAETPR